jgi:hypothetical protein
MVRYPRKIGCNVGDKKGGAIWLVMLVGHFEKMSDMYRFVYGMV